VSLSLPLSLSISLCVSPSPLSLYVSMHTQVLIDSKADLDLKARHRVPPLHLAIFGEHFDVVEVCRTFSACSSGGGARVWNSFVYCRNEYKPIVLTLLLSLPLSSQLPADPPCRKSEPEQPYGLQQQPSISSSRSMPLRAEHAPPSAPSRHRLS
jgi:hypothetical protein